MPRNYTRPIQALRIFILLSATIHIAVVIIHFLATFDLVTINYFKIIALDLLFPNITYGLASQIISVALMIGLYTIIFLFFTKRKKE